MQMTADEFAARFQDPVLQGALQEMWVPKFSLFFMLFTFAYLHKKDAGYPSGSLASPRRWRWWTWRPP